MAIKLGNGKWAIKENNLLAYNDHSGKFFNKEFDFTRGSNATYVNKDGLIKTALAANTPRIDFSDSANGSLLLEPSRTNQATNSQQMHTYSALGGSNPSPSLTANYITAPDGALTATRLQASTTGSNYSLLSFPGTSQGNGSYTVSVYVKSNTGQNQTIAFYGQSSGSAARTVTTEWTRIKFTGSRGSGLTKYAYLGTWNSNLGTDSNIDISIWGAQIEVDSTFATSYIPTQGATSTRIAETCTNSGSVQDINSEEGVLYAEISALANDGTNRFIILNKDNDSNNNRLTFRFLPTSNRFSMEVHIGGALKLTITATVPNATLMQKIALKYKQNDYAFWVNGVEVGVSTLAEIWSPNTLNNIDFTGFGQPFYGNVRELQVFTEALTDAQLQALTTI